MIDKPWAQMGEDELRQHYAEADARAKQLNNLFAEYRGISKIRSHAGTHLRDRFGVDPRTGRRIKRADKPMWWCK